ncbi:MAG: PilW family protein [Planctomycetota bacterium]|jgi:type II secretory pathway pseudopilin PulG
MKKAFSIVELLIAMGLFGMLLAASGVIFATAVKAHRTSEATTEISQNLAAIIDQFNADFAGLRKEGEIFAVWVAKPVDDQGNVVPYDAPNIAAFQRFDKIMFFADGDFQTYHQQHVLGGDKILTGNVARICYMLAQDGSDVKAESQNPSARILSRTQHIFTSENVLDPGDMPETFPLPAPANTFDPCEFEAKNFAYEYDTTTIQEWKNIDPCDKDDMLSVISGVNAGGGTGVGTPVSASDPATIHMLLCQGVGQFSVQGWYDPQQRWVPEIIWDEDGRIVATDFIVDDSDPGRIHEIDVPGILYSPPFYYNEAEFNFIPGLGRALKFTFTLYDSRGVFPEGKTFTHIVYLDD